MNRWSTSDINGIWSYMIKNYGKTSKVALKKSDKDKNMDKTNLHNPHKKETIFMYKKHAVAIVLAIAMAFSAVSNTILASAKTSNDLQNDITKIEEEKKKNQEEQDKLKNQKEQEQNELKNLQGQKNEIQGNVNSINGNISSVRGEITALQNKIVSNSSSLSTLSKEKEEAEDKQAAVKKELAARMKFAYESRGTDSILVVLMSSASFPEFINRAEYMIEIAKYDDELIDSLKKLSTSIDKKTAAIKKEQTDLATNRETLSAKQTALSQLLDSAEGSLEDKNGEVKEQAEVVAALDKNIAEYNAQAKQIDAKQASAQSSLADMILASEENNNQNSNNGSSTDPGTNPTDPGTNSTDPGSNPANPNPAPDNTSRTPIPASSAESGNRHAGIPAGAYGTYNYSDEEVKMLRAIVQAEAGNQGLSGQRAVASVIMNRVYSNNTSYKSIQSVIFAPGQFQPTAESMRKTWADGTVGTPYEFYYSHEDKISDTTKQAVSEVLGGQQFVYALFFMTPGAFSKQEWVWKNGRRVVDYTQLGGHVFFNVLTKNQQL